MSINQSARFLSLCIVLVAGLIAAQPCLAAPGFPGAHRYEIVPADPAGYLHDPVDSNKSGSRDPLTVLTTTPIDGGINIIRSTQVEMIFSAPVDPNSFNVPGSYQVVGDVSGAHAGVIVQGTSGRDIKFFATLAYALGETVTVTLNEDILADDGEQLVPHSFQFTVLAVGDAMPTLDHSGTIGVDETWTADLVHAVTGNVTVPSGVTLTIEPGAIVKFAAPGIDNAYRMNLYVEGSLIVEGTFGAPIIFTSSRDDVYGGDTNADGSASSGQPGDWGGIKYTGTVNSMTNASISYGGRNRTCCGWQDAYLHMIWVTDAAELTLDDCIVKDSYYNGVYTDNVNATLIVVDSTLYRTYYGIYATAFTSGVFSLNVLTLNTYPISQAGTAPTYSGNIFTGNVWQVIAVGETLTQDVLWQDLGIPYLVNKNLTIPAGYTLTIEPEIVVKFKAAVIADAYRLNIYIEGALDLQSTPSQPIVFTSSRDDEYGGDTNGDGSGSSPVAGDWGGMKYQGNTTNDFHDAIIRYGGRNRTCCGWQDAYLHMIWVTGDAALTVRDSIIEYSYRDGIYADSAGVALTVEDCTIHHTIYGIYATALLEGILDGNTFSDNTYPVYQSGTEFTYIDNTFIDNTWQVIAAGGTQTRDIVWEDVQGLGMPYLIISNLTIPEGLSLTIESGIVVKFLAATIDDAYRRNIYANGMMTTSGTSGSPVVFTSSRDDEHGGDTNSDGSASAPVPGDWGGIKYSASAINDIHNSILRYGGRNRTCCGWQDADLHMIWVTGNATLVIRDSVVEHSYNNGIYADSSSAVLAVENNLLQHNVYGVYATALDGGTLDGNTITENTIPVCQAGTDFFYTGNTITNNTWQVIAARGSLTRDVVWEDVQGLGMPYLINSNLTVPEGLSLTIDPGIVVKILATETDNAYRRNIYAEGVIDLLSSPCSPIVFTSSLDDTYGGDTNSDGSASSPGPGNWGGIKYSGTAINTLHDAIIRYGGRNRTCCGWQDAYLHMIWVTDNASLVIRDSVLEGFYSNAIYFDNTLASLAVENTSLLPARLAPNNYGLNNATGEEIIAQDNWWGDPTGPSGTGAGDGAAATANVDFDPWKLSAGSVSDGVVGWTDDAAHVNPPYATDLTLWESDEEIRAFNENFFVELSSDLAIEAVAPGVYDEGADLVSQVIPAGSYINSHLLHFNPVELNVVALSGTVTLDSTIVGVIVTDAGLDTTDTLLGREDLIYPVSGGRGLELGDTGSGLDEFEIMPDRRTIRYSGTVDLVEDQIRIITVGAADCNGNNWPDSCDIGEGTSQDNNSNGIPDECESETVEADLTCVPGSGTLPFSSLMSVTMTNIYPDQTRRIAVSIDITTGNGSSFSNWRSGYTNIAAGGSYFSSWSQNMIMLGSLVGTNTFQLDAMDVTPIPYNQPPYPMAGDTDTSFCDVIGIAP